MADDPTVSPTPDPPGQQPSSGSSADGLKEIDLTQQNPVDSERIVKQETIRTVPKVAEYDLVQAQEGTRGDLARGLLWLLTMTIGGMILFVGLGRLDGTLLAQSVFPSLVTLAGTALGFYFGSHTGRGTDDKSAGENPPPG